MKNPSFSFIVPAYNAEKNLRRCIDSLLRQSYRSFEAVIVNDGSRDGTGEICDSYAATDQRIKVIHKPNGGVGSARNVGLSHASGEYICFLDSDDWIDPDYLQHFSQACEIGSALVIFNHFVIGKKKVYKKHDHEDVILTNRNISELFSSLNFLRNGYVWSKIYSATIIQQHKINFDEEIHFAEDLLFNLQYLRHVDTVKFQKYAGYHYLHNVSTSLSARYNSFTSEYKAFEEIKAQLVLIIDRFPLDAPARLYINTWLGKFFLRTIQSFYFSKISTPFRSRLNMLQQAHRHDNLHYMAHVKHLNLPLKIRCALVLFRKKQLVLYDAYMMLLTKMFNIAYLSTCCLLLQ